MKQHILKSILILLVGVLLFSTVSCDKLGKNYTCSWCGMRLQDTYYAHTEMNLQVVDSKSRFWGESTKVISKPVIKSGKSTIRPSSSLYHKRCAIENEEEKNKKNFIYDEWHEYQIKGFVSQ